MHWLCLGNLGCFLPKKCVHSLNSARNPKRVNLRNKVRYLICRLLGTLGWGLGKFGKLVNKRTSLTTYHLKIGKVDKVLCSPLFGDGTLQQLQVRVVFVIALAFQSNAGMCVQDAGRLPGRHGTPGPRNEFRLCSSSRCTHLPCTQLSSSPNQRQLLDQKQHLYTDLKTTTISHLAQGQADGFRSQSARSYTMQQPSTRTPRTWQHTNPTIDPQPNRNRNEATDMINATIAPAFAIATTTVDFWVP